MEEIGKVFVEFNSENVGSAGPGLSQRWAGGLSNVVEEIVDSIEYFNSENVGLSDAPPSVLLSPEQT